MARVCAPGGAVIIEDQAPPPDPSAAETLREMDRLRDPSHTRAVAPEEWAGHFEALGLRLDRIETSARKLDFDEWMNRAHPAPDAEARARGILDAVLDGARPGPRAWREGATVHFEMGFQRVRATKP